MAVDTAKTERPSGRPAVLVGTGILLSRILGLVREGALAHYLGTSDAADAFRAALRIPNFLQNLFGEGVLSASFIPVYARLLGAKNEEEADHVASVIGSVLALLTSTLVLIGVLCAPILIDAIAPGFHGAKRELTITLVRIMFPGIGALVLSAWCLGVLNSHGKFFLSYTAPVVWNVAIIVVLLLCQGVQSLPSIAI
jgi:putative peptidoglycan lipid II flippase